MNSMGKSVSTGLLGMVAMISHIQKWEETSADNGKEWERNNDNRDSLD